MNIRAGRLASRQFPQRKRVTSRQPKIGSTLPILPTRTNQQRCTASYIAMSLETAPIVAGLTNRASSVKKPITDDRLSAYSQVLLTKIAESTTTVGQLSSVLRATKVSSVVRPTGLTDGYNIGAVEGTPCVSDSQPIATNMVPVA